MKNGDLLQIPLESFVISMYNLAHRDYFCRGAEMDFNWITAQEAAEAWGISDRRVQFLCANGKVEDAVRLKRGWLIPKGTLKPADGRAKNGRKPASDKMVNVHE
ncbi:MAG: helix-turn-helix domain-containing protein [Oscillospiraceae bacterium]|nr:helix-turn-helix domain-containing protein [Oscillospiraceae bacterium]